MFANQEGNVTADQIAVQAGLIELQRNAIAKIDAVPNTAARR